MDIWENASLTEKGVDLHNRLINGKTLKITKVKTGAGKVPVMYLRQQTEVTNPIQELTLQPATISDDNIIIPVLLENIGLTESYELWQVGFYAEDPDEGEILYCIAQAAKGKDIPTEHESPGYSIVWNFHFKNSEENPFELNITPAGLVSMETLKKHTSDVNIHVTQEEKNAFYDKYTRSEVDNKFAALETNIDWKEAVDTYTDIMEMYPKPQDGWTVNVKDTDYTYRYNGTDWIAISSNAIPKATPALDGLMSKEQAASLNKLEQAVGSLQNLTTSEKQNLVGAVNEVKSEVVQLNSDLLNKVYPVGSVYISINSISPSNIFGGTWERFAQGRTLVGVNESDSNFNVVSKTGGESTVTLNTNQIPSHSHQENSLVYIYDTSYAANASIVTNNSKGKQNIVDNILNKPYTSSSGGGKAHSNLQPYITTYIWVRTS